MVAELHLTSEMMKTSNMTTSKSKQGAARATAQSTHPVRDSTTHLVGSGSGYGYGAATGTGDGMGCGRGNLGTTGMGYGASIACGSCDGYGFGHGTDD